MLEVYYSRKMLLPYAFICIAAGAWGFYELAEGQFWLGCLLTFLVAVMAGQTFPRLFNLSAQIVVKDTGLITSDRGEVSWNRIRTAAVIRDASTKDWYMDVQYKDRDEEGNADVRVPLKDMAVDPEVLSEAINEHIGK